LEKRLPTCRSVSGFRPFQPVPALRAAVSGMLIAPERAGPWFLLGLIPAGELWDDAAVGDMASRAEAVARDHGALHILRVALRKVYDDDPPYYGSFALPGMVEAGARSGDRSAAQAALTRLAARAIARVSAALNGFTATQHISPNHVIEFAASDPDRAVCYSYMYAQHLLSGSGNGEFYLLRGSYDNHMLRTADGWRIERIIQHRSWEYGNTSAVAEAIARSQPQPPASQPGSQPIAHPGAPAQTPTPASCKEPAGTGTHTLRHHQ
jgi:hypothetical protein